MEIIIKDIVRYPHKEKDIRRYIDEVLDNIKSKFDIKINIKKIIVCKKVIDEDVDYEIDGLYYPPSDNYIKVKFDEEKEFTEEVMDFKIILYHELMHNLMNQYFSNDFNEVKDFIDEFNAYYYGNLSMCGSIVAEKFNLKEQMREFIEEFDKKNFTGRDEWLNNLAKLIAFKKLLKEEYGVVEYKELDLELANESLYKNKKIPSSYNYEFVESYININES